MVWTFQAATEGGKASAREAIFLATSWIRSFACNQVAIVSLRKTVVKTITQEAASSGVPLTPKCSPLRRATSPARRFSRTARASSSLAATERYTGRRTFSALEPQSPGAVA
jgi:hypothetical protein